MVFVRDLPSSSPGVSERAVFLRGAGGNVVIKTQSILNILDDEVICGSWSVGRSSAGGWEGSGPTFGFGGLDERFRFREELSVMAGTAGVPEGRRYGRG